MVKYYAVLSRFFYSKSVIGFRKSRDFRDWILTFEKKKMYFITTRLRCIINDEKINEEINRIKCEIGYCE